jgi:DNA-directed RNA polymerase sigma subunit (sigma70/sigma32)
VSLEALPAVVGSAMVSRFRVARESSTLRAAIRRVWVRQAMQQLIAELTRPTVLSDRTLRHLAQLKRAHGDYLREHGHEPTDDQLASHTGLTHAQVSELLALERIPRSMDC